MGLYCMLVVLVTVTRTVLMEVLETEVQLEGVQQNRMRELELVRSIVI